MVSVEHSNSFSINLISNSSTYTYPGNTMSSFTNFLPRSIDLNKKFGQWQVALVEISWPAKFKNVTQGNTQLYKLQNESSDSADSNDDDDESIEPTSADELYVGIGRRRRHHGTTNAATTFQKARNLRIKIEAGYYPTLDHLMTKIFSKSFGSKREFWPLKWSVSSHSQKLKLLSTDNMSGILSTEDYQTATSEGEQTEGDESNRAKGPSSIELLSTELQNILGTSLLKLGVEPKYPIDLLGGRHTMFVYCDLIQDEILGSTLTSLLRSVPLTKVTNKNENTAVICHHSFSNLQWKPVVKSSFQSITITIRDETGH